MNDNKKYILALDIGTTSTRAILFDKNFTIAAMAQEPISQFYPSDSWVEQSPGELYAKTLSVMLEVLNKVSEDASAIAAIGITNQRETTIVWDKKTGEPVYNAIVWQDKRTSEQCYILKKNGLQPEISSKTGLQIDPYFSATKLQWILENVEGAHARAQNGELLFGTVDTWILWHLTGRNVHATDVSNASRTLLFNIHTLQWDDELCALFGIPMSVLPQVLPSSGMAGLTDSSVLGASVPITGIAGDQQAALFGQACFDKGMTKNTYGTGCFILMNCGNKPVTSTNGLVTTVAWQIGEEVCYALEGSVFIAGSLIKWLRDELGMIKDASDTETLALQAKGEQDVYFVPCFSGLGAPRWDMNARGVLVGLSLSTTREHIVKAALESLAWQTKDVTEAMQKDAGTTVSRLHVDGGASVNNFLMQFQADILNTTVVRPEVTESTALGAALLAALEVGFISKETFLKKRQINRLFSPMMDDDTRNKRYNRWLNAVKRAESWK